MLEIVKPMDIEKRSFEIITELLGDTPIAVSYTHLTLPTNREV